MSKAGGVKEENTQFLRDMQYFVVAYAMGPSTTRGAAAGTLAAVRTYCTHLDLSLFSTSDPDLFRSRLDAATDELLTEHPEMKWGWARKLLNIFLRDCLYNFYLREHYQLDKAERLLEVALDSFVAGGIRRRNRELPPWDAIKWLDRSTSERYQQEAARIAESQYHARVHLDAFFWSRGIEAEPWPITSTTG